MSNLSFMLLMLLGFATGGAISLGNPMLIIILIIASIMAAVLHYRIYRDEI